MMSAYTFNDIECDKKLQLNIKFYHELFVRYGASSQLTLSRVTYKGHADSFGMMRREN